MGARQPLLDADQVSRGDAGRPEAAAADRPLLAAVRAARLPRLCPLRFPRRRQGRDQAARGQSQPRLVLGRQDEHHGRLPGHALLGAARPDPAGGRGAASASSPSRRSSRRPPAATATPWRRSRRLATPARCSGAAGADPLRHSPSGSELEGVPTKEPHAWPSPVAVSSLSRPPERLPPPIRSPPGAPLRLRARRSASMRAIWACTPAAPTISRAPCRAPSTRRRSRAYRSRSAPAVYRAGDLKLPAGAQLIGVRGATRLVLSRGASPHLGQPRGRIVSLGTHARRSRHAARRGARPRPLLHTPAACGSRIARSSPRVATASCWRHARAR